MLKKRGGWQTPEKIKSISKSKPIRTLSNNKKNRRRPKKRPSKKRRTRKRRSRRRYKRRKTRRR